MICCPDSTAPGTLAPSTSGRVDPWVRELADGRMHIDLLAPDIHCAGCISRIEKTLRAQPGVLDARVNLTTRRIALDWRKGAADPNELTAVIEGLGYRIRPYDPKEMAQGARDEYGRRLLRSLAVAGFAMGNVMLLSVSIWSGADGATRDMFHWISAAIALPAVAFAGQPFFHSAFAALNQRRMNMDVPISLAVILSAALSLYETIHGGANAYYDASVTLLFFLLAGRYLDHMMRERARTAVTQLMALSAEGALVEREDGTRIFVLARDLEPGMTVCVAAGERIPADGRLIAGRTDIDRSLVTGETLPEAIEAGGAMQAGATNLTAPIKLRVEAVGEDTFLAEIIRLMEAAEKSRSVYVRIADRAAAIYAPAVHLLALATLIGWLIWTGGDWRVSAFTAITVLIITCPCALGLAVPAVQVVASGLLFRRGVMMRDGAALEKLAEINVAAFDKTGTLTLGRPALVEPGLVPPPVLALAAGLARDSAHPLSKAAAASAAAQEITPAAVTDVEEHPGAGLSGYLDGREVRLGSRRWCGAQGAAEDRHLELWLRDGNAAPALLRFEDALRPRAAETIAALRASGIEVMILSGDRKAAVAWIAAQLGVENWRAELTPQDKIAAIEALTAAGRKPLVIGDGLNDAPMLAAGYASMAPAGATDIGRAAADFVLTGQGLEGIADTLDVARRAHAAIRQNFALSILYNSIAVPLAIFGFASPLVAAVAMSSSSIVVTANALRLRLRKSAPLPAPPAISPVANSGAPCSIPDVTTARTSA